MQSTELAYRLGWAEVELEEAYARAEANVSARSRLEQAKREYRAAEAAVITSLGARAALALVENTLMDDAAGRLDSRMASA
jgi:hypothetical protein